MAWARTVLASLSLLSAAAAEAAAAASAAAAVSAAPVLSVSSQSQQQLNLHRQQQRDFQVEQQQAQEELGMHWRDNDASGLVVMELQHRPHAVSAERWGHSPPLASVSTSSSWYALPSLLRGAAVAQKMKGGGLLNASLVLLAAGRARQDERRSEARSVQRRLTEDWLTAIQTFDNAATAADVDAETAATETASETGMTVAAISFGGGGTSFSSSSSSSFASFSSSSVADSEPSPPPPLSSSSSSGGRRQLAGNPNAAVPAPGGTAPLFEGIGTHYAHIYVRHL